MKSISGKTKLIGLLGEPVDHSISPIIQNAAIQEMGLDWCYLAMPCKAKDISNVLLALRNLNCQGLNITIPHKNLVAKQCAALSSISKKISAVNTLIPTEQNGWFGTNTDIEGFIAPLKSKALTKDKALIIGCGGSAKAVATGLEDLQFKEILVTGRNSSKLKYFIEEMKISFKDSISSGQNINSIDCSSPDLINVIQESDLIVNTTPIGMQNLSTKISMPLGEKIWSNLNTKTILYDLIYIPKQTKWLEFGKKLNCETIDGLEMLLNQGAASLRLWSGEKDIPIETMRNAAKKHLKV